MSLESLQKIYSIKAGNKQLVPCITSHFNDMYHIRYDLDNTHLQFEITEDNLYNRIYLADIKRKAIEWVEEIEENDN